MKLRRLALPTALAGALALTVFALPHLREPADHGTDRFPMSAMDSLATSRGRADERPLEIAGAHIMIAHRDSRPATPGVTRTPDEAHDLALRLATEILDNRASFAELARRHSDDARTASSGGQLGVIHPGRLPLSMEVTFAQLEIGQISPCVESPAGFHVLMRVPVRRAMARHIMIAWQGALGDGGTVARSRIQAQAMASEIAAKAQAPDADFCELAARFSDDERSRFECGLIGLVEPGNLEPAFEDILFAMKPGEVSGVVESSYGFHVVKRDPEPFGTAVEDGRTDPDPLQE